MTQDKSAQNPKFNRRDALEYFGVGAATTLTPGLASSTNLAPVETHRADVIVIGAGFAGVDRRAKPDACGQKKKRWFWKHGTASEGGSKAALWRAARLMLAARGLDQRRQKRSPSLRNLACTSYRNMKRASRSRKLTANAQTQSARIWALIHKHKLNTTAW
jgi:hypothetical protein